MIVLYLPRTIAHATMNIIEQSISIAASNKLSPDELAASVSHTAGFWTGIAAFVTVAAALSGVIALIYTKQDNRNKDAVIARLNTETARANEVAALANEGQAKANARAEEAGRDAARANEGIALANERAAVAQLALEQLRAQQHPRTIGEQISFGKKLSEFAGTKVQIVFSSDHECQMLAGELGAGLKYANWEFEALAGTGMRAGVQITPRRFMGYDKEYKAGDLPPGMKATDALLDALLERGIVSEKTNVPQEWALVDTILVTIGPRPAPEEGELIMHSNKMNKDSEMENFSENFAKMRELSKRFFARIKQGDRPEKVPSADEPGLHVYGEKVFKFSPKPQE